MKVLVVIGTRPNFIKVTQFKKEAAKFQNLELKMVHTGQHFDDKMADVFFRQFDLQPDWFLNIPAGSANTQIAEIMLRLEKLMQTEFMPDLMVVVGDVNSTLAAALCANKMGVKLAHVESGLRSKDRSMPEEINRLLTDEITDYFFVTEKSGWDHLIEEGKAEKQLCFVGNTMIDTLVAFHEDVERCEVLQTFGLKKQGYVLMTMHRPATVDVKEELSKLLELIEYITQNYQLVFPIHPRTLKNLEKFGLLTRFRDNKNIIATEPLDYFSFQKLISDCKFIVTDSGGIQEESTFRKVPCLTLRPNTERPVTCDVGTNTLVPFELAEVKRHIQAIENGSYKEGAIPTLWDGKSTSRIMEFLSDLAKLNP